jgi:hypothetical protein
MKKRDCWLSSPPNNNRKKESTLTIRRVVRGKTGEQVGAMARVRDGSPRLFVLVHGCDKKKNVDVL